MEWKKDKAPFEAGDIKVSDDEDEGEFQDEEYSPWQTTSPAGLGKKIFQRPDLPLKTIGIGLLVVVAAIIILVFVTDSDEDRHENKIIRLENRVQEIESQLADIGKAFNESGATTKKTADLAARLDRLETSIHSRMGQITTQVSALKKQVVAKKAITRTQSKISKNTEKAAVTARSHKVTSGDTLYDIARRYGVTIKQIKQWNKLPSSGRIYPGQKLNVGS